MSETNREYEEMRTLISGYIDGELDADERGRVERFAEAHPEYRREIERMRETVAAADELQPAPLPDEVWDTFLDGVYNRVERRVGWILTVTGASALLLVATYFLVVLPWAPTAVKLAVELLLVGLAVLFVSVLRQRLFMLKSDRYSRDVKR
jgi:anti-sigma factor RsiW